MIEDRDDGVRLDRRSRPLTLTVAAIGVERTTESHAQCQVDVRHTVRAVEYDSDRPMRVLNAAQMREADRRTIEEIGIPSLVLMENAGRQVVAAIEAVLRRPARAAASPSSAAAATTAATASSSRARCCSAASTSRSSCIGRVADVRGDARINLEILGRLGLTVVEIADSQAWELHFSEIARLRR